MLHLLLALGIFGLITSTIYSIMVIAGVVRYRARRGQAASINFFPPVSVLKALHGDEPDLERNLTSFFEQDYPSFEILFCARRADDAGLTIARRVAARYPQVESSIHLSGEPEWPNARTYSLEIMRRAARQDILVMADSDVYAERDYLAKVVQPLQDANVGMVTCVYRGVTKHGLWARLEALGMSVEMTSGVLVAEMLEGMQFALGPTMVIRKSTVRKIGGFAPVGQYHADDFILGNWVHRSGETVVLSTYPIEHHVVNTSFASTFAHQLGWATSTRFSRPKGHAGTIFTFAMPFGLLAFATLSAAHYPYFGVAALAWAYLDRVLLSVLVGGLVVRDRKAVAHAWLYPLRDLTGFFFWAASYLRRRLRYRGELYELRFGGTLHRVDPKSEHAAAEQTSLLRSKPKS